MSAARERIMRGCGGEAADVRKFESCIIHKKASKTNVFDAFSCFLNFLAVLVDYISIHWICLAYFADEKILYSTNRL